MAIKVKTTSDITGSSEHEVTADSLKAAGVDVSVYEPSADLRTILEWAKDEDHSDFDSDNGSGELDAVINRLHAHYFPSDQL